MTVLLANTRQRFSNYQFIGSSSIGPPLLPFHPTRTLSSTRPILFFLPFALRATVDSGSESVSFELPPTLVCDDDGGEYHLEGVVVVREAETGDEEEARGRKRDRRPSSIGWMGHN